jgi:hypothetical protein
MEAHFRATEAYFRVINAHYEAVKAHPITLGYQYWSSEGSSWSHTGSLGAMEALQEPWELSWIYGNSPWSFEGSFSNHKGSSIVIETGGPSFDRRGLILAPKLIFPKI